MPRFRKGSHTSNEFHDGRHRFEHWYRDNTVYFITARCRDQFLAFSSERAKAVFWDRFHYWTGHYGFEPWVTSLLDNHYHVIGFLPVGNNLGPMMQRVHGSVAKLVNDLLPARHVPFWKGQDKHDYFDGCIREVLQLRRAYHYTLMQAVRARRVTDWRHYPHTRVGLSLDEGIEKALRLEAFLEDVPYARYDRKKKRDEERGRGEGEGGGGRTGVVERAGDMVAEATKPADEGNAADVPARHDGSLAHISHAIPIAPHRAGSGLAGSWLSGGSFRSRRPMSARMRGSAIAER